MKGLLSPSTSTPRKEVQLLLEEFWQLKQTWQPRQSWSGGSQGSSCSELCWLLEGRCKPGKEGPGGDGGESPVLTQSKAEPVMFFPRKPNSSGFIFLLCQNGGFGGQIYWRGDGWQAREEATRDLPSLELFKQVVISSFL